MGIQLSSKLKWENATLWSQTMISAIRRWIARRAVYRRTYRDLYSMSDRELYDLGITRGDIEGLAYEATYGEKKNG